MVDEAHGEVKLALQELRDLARGIHPAVLTDRGLDAALSSVASRCTVPVKVTADLAARPARRHRGHRLLHRLGAAAERQQAQRGAVRVRRRVAVGRTGCSSRSGTTARAGRASTAVRAWRGSRTGWARWTGCSSSTHRWAVRRRSRRSCRGGTGLRQPAARAGATAQGGRPPASPGGRENPRPRRRRPPWSRRPAAAALWRYDSTAAGRGEGRRRWPRSTDRATGYPTRARIHAAGAGETAAPAAGRAAGAGRGAHLARVRLCAAEPADRASCCSPRGHDGVARRGPAGHVPRHPGARGGARRVPGLRRRWSGRGRAGCSDWTWPSRSRCG